MPNTLKIDNDLNMYGMTARKAYEHYIKVSRDPDRQVAIDAYAAFMLASDDYDKRVMDARIDMLMGSA